jgi:purine catabolism regulator
MRPQDQQLVLAACSLLALQSEQSRRGTAGPRSSIACVARLVTTGYVDAARSLSADLGLGALPSSVRILAVAGLGEGQPNILQDVVEQAVPRRRSQVLCIGRSDDLWVLLRDNDIAPVLKAVRQFAASTAPGARSVVSGPTALAGVVRHIALVQQALSVLPPGALRDLTVPDHGIAGSDGNNTAGLVDLGPLVDYSRADLVRAVVAYLRHRGRWEDAARDLGVHRNTLRHRIGTASRVLGADLNDPDVASRLWLALRAGGLA